MYKLFRNVTQMVVQNFVFTGLKTDPSRVVSLVHACCIDHHCIAVKSARSCTLKRAHERKKFLLNSGYF